MAPPREFGALVVPGCQATYVYRMDADPREGYVAVIFESKARYDANANSPEQDARYQEIGGARAAGARD